MAFKCTFVVEKSMNGYLHIPFEWMFLLPKIDIIIDLIFLPYLIEDYSKLFNILCFQSRQSKGKCIGIFYGSKYVHMSSGDI